MNKNNVLGCLMGMALGDALGANVEFLTVDEILEQFPPNGPQAPLGNPARITDDTQMALAVGNALAAATFPFTPDNLGAELTRTFKAWYLDPENDRAPGNTCLVACEELLSGKSWREASQMNAKGCGANMRVIPVGVLNLDMTTRSAIAQFQAAFTHGHPTALAAADLTAFVIAELGNRTKPETLLESLFTYIYSQREIYHTEWLGDLWERAVMVETPQDYIARGWDSCLEVLERLATAVKIADHTVDPCVYTGDGWVAEEAFATALLCFLLFPDDPVAVIRRAAVTRGDSDSIACIAGAFAGAYRGLEAWPTDWVDRIEYRDHLLAMSDALFQR